MTHLVLDGEFAGNRVTPVLREPQWRWQFRQPRLNQFTQFGQRSLGLETCAECADAGNEGVKLFGREFGDSSQEAIGKRYAALDPAQSARQFDKVPPQFGGRRL
ncbi:MAG: hypothetical protein OXC10_21470 [Rhodospirillaceae bacterium]|nr:hypothetical protein [Rhodospirillaceae bacterium]